MHFQGPLFGFARVSIQQIPGRPDSAGSSLSRRSPKKPRNPVRHAQCRFRNCDARDTPPGSSLAGLTMRARTPGVDRLHTDFVEVEILHAVAAPCPSIRVGPDLARADPARCREPVGRMKRGEVRATVDRALDHDRCGLGGSMRSLEPRDEPDQRTDDRDRTGRDAECVGVCRQPTLRLRRFLSVLHGLSVGKEWSVHQRRLTLLGSVARAGRLMNSPSNEGARVP
jgi:hypothetical protein